MKGLLFVLFCSVYSAQAWQYAVQNLRVTPVTGTGIPPKHQPTPDDLQATRKAKTFINFLKFVPQLNPFQHPSLGPYDIDFPEFRLRINLLLQNVLVTDLRKINIPDLQIQLNPPRIDFTAILPTVHTSANFIVAGYYGKRQINTQGRFNVTMSNLQVSGAVAPKIVPIDGRQVYQVSDGALTISFENGKLVAEMNQFSEEFHNRLEDFLTHLDQHPATVNDILKIILKGVSHELKMITSNEILTYLLGNQAPSMNLLGK